MNMNKKISKINQNTKNIFNHKEMNIKKGQIKHIN